MADIEQELESAVRDTETDILNSAFDDEPKGEPETVEETKSDERPRDESGKFIAKEAPKSEPAAEQPAQAEPDKAVEDDDKGQVPSWRLREVAQEKRAAEEKARQLEQQLSTLNQRLAGLEKPKEAPKAERPDPLLDPEGYDRWIMGTIDRQRQEDRLNFNLALAHTKHGEKFEKAFQALLAEGQTGNQQLVASLTSQANPGEAIVRWHSDRETLKEVGNDPASYRNKVLEEALKNPEFLAKAIEAAKSSAGQPRQNNVTQLPPSLSRVAGSTHKVDPLDTDDSDEAVFRYATS